MIISFASGKGGTGKTIIATSYALWLSHKHNHPPIQFLDCDVEEPNAAIFLKPKINKTISVGIQIPVVDTKKCTYCGKCADICVYNAIAVVKNTKQVLIFEELCHGCGGCTLLCPENALSKTSKEIGVLEIGNAGTIKFIHGKLNIGEPMAPPLIKEIKQKAFSETVKRRNGETEEEAQRCKITGKQEEINKQTNNQLLFDQFTIIDVPPGTSCPVIEAVKGSDYTVLVTEPTPFGLNDLILAVDTLRVLNLRFGVVINRDGVGDKKTEDYCRKEHIPILMRIPLDREIAVAYSKGIPLLEVSSQYKTAFSKLHEEIVSNA